MVNQDLCVDHDEHMGKVDLGAQQDISDSSKLSSSLCKAVLLNPVLKVSHKIVWTSGIPLLLRLSLLGKLVKKVF